MEVREPPQDSWFEVHVIVPRGRGLAGAVVAVPSAITLAAHATKE